MAVVHFRAQCSLSCLLVEDGLHFFKSLTYSPSRQTIQTQLYSEKDHLIRSGMECCLLLLTGSAHIQRETVDHQGAVAFDFSCHTSKYILATATCILKGCKYQGNLSSEQQLGALVCLVIPSIFISVYLYFHLRSSLGNRHLAHFGLLQMVPVFQAQFSLLFFILTLDSRSRSMENMEASLP